MSSRTDFYVHIIQPVTVRLHIVQSISNPDE